MLKNYIYLNSLFIFGLLIYLFSQKFTFSLQNTFYMFFSLFSTVIPGLFLFNGYRFQDRRERSTYQLLFCGFWIYGVANFIWYLNDTLNLKISENYLNLFFIFQIFTKDYFLKYLVQKYHNFKPNLIHNIFSINLGIGLFLVFATNFLNLKDFLSNLFFIYESIFSIIFVLYYSQKILDSYLDLNLFGYGSLVWLLADTVYYFESFKGVYVMGDISDFLYYFGFYLMLSAILFKNFNFVAKLNFYFDKKFSFA